MGFVRIKVALENPAGQPAQRRSEIELLVDTGARYSMVPAKVLRDLGVEPRQRLPFELATGTIVQRDVGDVRFYYDGREAVSPVIFGEEDDVRILGVVTLEAMGLEVDPVRRQIRPARLILY